MAFLFRGYQKRPAHPDWVLDACSQLCKTASLYSANRIPGSIESPMIVIPVKRILRGVFGSDLKAAWFLLLQALGKSFRESGWTLVRFWKYSVLRKRQPTTDEILTILEADKEEE